MNTFTYFTVSEKSFHQVSEVINKTGKSRSSISGWYHGTPKKRAAKKQDIIPIYKDIVQYDEILLGKFSSSFFS